MNYLLGIFILGFSLIANANANDTLSINVEPKQKTFVVTLDANPTTGYQWSVVTFDKKLINLSASKFVRPQTNLIGAGGSMLFTFKINDNAHLKTTSIVFKYARPWEHGKGIVKKVRVHFVQ
ncbi:MAG: protease inhibitor I42 family protein [bacterium]|nr:protease inhibitor I42 family protein [bacterium]